MVVQQRKCVLVVDDTPANIGLAMAALKDEYRVKVANNGHKALEIVQQAEAPDLILLDIMMPEMDGYEVCAELKKNPKTADIPVIFLTANSQIEDEIKGFNLGAIDYIHKPFSPPIVQARVRNQLLVKAAADIMKNQNVELERMVAKRTQQISQTQNLLIMALSSLAETRDNETGNHLRRTQHYVNILVDQLYEHPRFGDYFQQFEDREMFFKLAPLHDIGKVGIPDSILLKPGKLTDDEFTVMKTHPILGKESIESAERQLGSSVEFLQIAKDIVGSHHERWDGAGYPYGLGGDDIPIAARLMMVADVYDALISKRVYKDGFTHERALQMMEEGSGHSFDPDVIEALFACEDKVYTISQTYK